MSIEKTDITMFSKVQSLGARFFEKFVSTKAMNKKLTEMNNIGLRNVIIATAVSQTTDFGNLEVGDTVLIGLASNAVEWTTIAVKGDLGQAAVVGQLYVQITPSM
tara:strand:- start:3494 stop:3808 length:315 start_codon:yes stop_codon:yes gene_type:complete